MHRLFAFMAQDWSFSDVMFVTKKNMANAVATVSKQMENVSETLAVSSMGCSFE
jgi:hypothetical protein